MSAVPKEQAEAGMSCVYVERACACVPLPVPVCVCLCLGVCVCVRVRLRVFAFVSVCIHTRECLYTEANNTAG